jgi:hypothetical protein
MQLYDTKYNLNMKRTKPVHKSTGYRHRDQQMSITVLHYGTEKAQCFLFGSK